jgi:hypothetical protein
MVGHPEVLAAGLGISPDYSLGYRRQSYSATQRYAATGRETFLS